MEIGTGAQDVNKKKNTSRVYKTRIVRSHPCSISFKPKKKYFQKNKYKMYKVSKIKYFHFVTGFFFCWHSGLCIFENKFCFLSFDVFMVNTHIYIRIRMYMLVRLTRVACSNDVWKAHKFLLCLRKTPTKKMFI